MPFACDIIIKEDEKVEKEVACEKTKDARYSWCLRVKVWQTTQAVHKDTTHIHTLMRAGSQSKNNDW